MMMTVKCKKIKKINYKVKNIQHKYLHHNDYLLLLNYEQQQITNLYKFTMTAVMLCNISDVDDDIFNK